MDDGRTITRTLLCCLLVVAALVALMNYGAKVHRHATSPAEPTPTPTAARLGYS
jgi:hypothetical protein